MRRVRKRIEGRGSWCRGRVGKGAGGDLPCVRVFALRGPVGQWHPHGCSGAAGYVGLGLGRVLWAGVRDLGGTPIKTALEALGVERKENEAQSNPEAPPALVG